MQKRKSACASKKIDLPIHVTLKALSNGAILRTMSHLQLLLRTTFKRDDELVKNMQNSTGSAYFLPQDLPLIYFQDKGWLHFLARLSSCTEAKNVARQEQTGDGLKTKSKQTPVDCVRYTKNNQDCEDRENPVGSDRDRKDMKRERSDGGSDRSQCRVVAGRHQREEQKIFPPLDLRKFLPLFPADDLSDFPAFSTTLKHGGAMCRIASIMQTSPHLKYSNAYFYSTVTHIRNDRPSLCVAELL